jgi:hypothetical protein
MVSIGDAVCDGRRRVACAADGVEPARCRGCSCATVSVVDWRPDRRGAGGPCRLSPTGTARESVDGWLLRCANAAVIPEAEQLKERERLPDG